MSWVAIRTNSFNTQICYLCEKTLRELKTYGSETRRCRRGSDTVDHISVWGRCTCRHHIWTQRHYNDVTADESAPLQTYQHHHRHRRLLLGGIASAQAILPTVTYFSVVCLSSVFCRIRALCLTYSDAIWQAFVGSKDVDSKNMSRSEKNRFESRNSS